MQIALKIIIISIFIAIVSYGVGLLLKGNQGAIPASTRGTASGSGVLFSEDRGVNWATRGETTRGTDLSRLTITDVRIHPAEPLLILAGTDGGGLYRSLDGGEYWEAVEDENGVLVSRSTIAAIAVDPTDTKRFFIAVFQNGRGSVLGTNDGGARFSELYFATKEKVGVNAVALSAVNKKDLFIGTDEGLILESIDDGRSWRSQSQIGGKVVGLVANPDGALIAIVQAKGLLRSVDRGVTWEASKASATGKALSSFAGALSVQDIAVDPRNANLLYVASAYGLLRSRDGGISFESTGLIIPPRALPVTALAIDPRDSNFIIVAAGQAIYRSLDSGEHWSPHEVATNKRLRILRIHPENTNLMFMGTGK